MKYGVAGKVYPNGEFGVYRVRRFNPSWTVQRIWEEEPRREVDEVQLPDLQLTIFDTPGTVDREVSLEPQTPLTDQPPLVSTVPANSHKTARGSKGITSYGRRMVRNAAYLLEKTYGGQHLSFLTLTVPDLEGEQWSQLTHGWSEVVRVFLQWLKRRLTGLGLPGLIVSVTELQEERAKRDGVPALHLHILFVGRKRKKSWAIKPKEFRESWLRALGGQVEKLSECKNKESCENVTRVKKSAEKYLGKYMSKGCNAVKESGSVLEKYGSPHTWQNMTSDLRKWIKRQIRVIPEGMCYWLFTCLMEKSSIELDYSYVHQVTTRMGYTLTVGGSGKIARSILPAWLKAMSDW